MRAGTSRTAGRSEEAGDCARRQIRAQPCATRGPRREGNPECDDDRTARDLPKDFAEAAPARRLEALQWVALDSDRSITIDHSLEM
jgi:hypothetical protein